MVSYLGLRGSELTVAIGLATGLCFSLYGYDQADLGGLLTVPSFRRQFSRIDTIGHPGDRHVAIIQGVTLGAWNLGCVASAVSTIWLGSFLGRKKTVIVGLVFLIIGEAIQCSSYSLGQFIVGRVVAGIGNGFNTATLPAWQAETSRAHRRGMLVMISGSFISLGIMFAYWMDFVFAYLEPSSAAWRVPIAIQLAVALTVLVLVFFLPESPRWLILNGRAQEALNVLAALDDARPDDSIVYKEFLAIKDAVIAAGATGGFSGVFTNKNGTRHLHRTILACTVQLLQQISGVNLINQYLALLLFQQTGWPGWFSRLLAGCIGSATVLASIIPVVGIDRFWGRRSLMMFGAVGMCASMIVLTVMRYLNNSTTNIVATVFFFVFDAFFVIGWQGMTWLYSAEIVPLRIRAPANALSTATNWLGNWVVVVITPIAFNDIGWRTYIIFAACSAVILPIVYFFMPETAFRTLEEVDVFFYAASQTRSPYLSVVRKSHEAPLWYGRDGQADFDYERSQWHRRFVRTQQGSSDEGSSEWQSPESSGGSDEKQKASGSGSGSGNGSAEGDRGGSTDSPVDSSAVRSEAATRAVPSRGSSVGGGRLHAKDAGRAS